MPQVLLQLAQLQLYMLSQNTAATGQVLSSCTALLVELAASQPQEPLCSQLQLHFCVLRALCLMSEGRYNELLKTEKERDAEIEEAKNKGKEKAEEKKAETGRVSLAACVGYCTFCLTCCSRHDNQGFTQQSDDAAVAAAAIWWHAGLCVAFHVSVHHHTASDSKRVLHNREAKSVQAVTFAGIYGMLGCFQHEVDKLSSAHVHSVCQHHFGLVYHSSMKGCN